MQANPDAIAETNLISKQENMFVLGSAYNVDNYYITNADYDNYHKMEYKMPN